jgi:hypothetical protein
MKLHSFWLLIIMLFPLSTAVGQKASVVQDTQQVVIVPRENALLTIAYQPDCPLQFEDVKFLAAIDGGGAVSYNLRNRSSRTISGFKVWDSVGHTVTWTLARANGGEPLYPGHLVPWGESGTKIVPITDNLAEKLRLKGPMQATVVLMVIRVDFADGTNWEDEAIYKATKAYMDDLQQKLYRLSYLENEKKRGN